MMEDKYYILSERMKSKITKMESICLTCDCWTEKHTTTAYLDIIVHFLINTTMESAMLGVTQLSESHTSVHLAEQIINFCEEWSINIRNVNMVVTDNAENIKQAVKTVFGTEKYIPCFDHTLNLIPKAALTKKIIYDNEIANSNIPDVFDLIKKVKTIVTFSHKSYNFSDMLKKIQMQRGKTEELVTIRTISSILRPFTKATKEMSAEHSTTISKIIPMVYILREKIRSINVLDFDPVAEKFRRFILAELNRRFMNIEQNVPIAIATILDPRFKKTYFNDRVAISGALNHISNEMKQMIQKQICNFLLF
ncbi:zinc finger BED domain-containing protein 4-like [Harpegnathos saltator]|uniref:zinc finger BED domain-containing protein 4-like n=1 Tax=Harpegnathos saltator TaxID=610380 RepID=UPI000DBED2AC|nr:zinc finger BED domain-containing protein 4-like [Harpegnathos saltator]